MAVEHDLWSHLVLSPTSYAGYVLKEFLRGILSLRHCKQILESFFLIKKQNKTWNTTKKTSCKALLECSLLLQNHVHQITLYSGTGYCIPGVRSDLWTESVAIVTFCLKAGLAQFPRSGFWCEYLIPKLTYIRIFPWLKFITVFQWRQISTEEASYFFK